MRITLILAEFLFMNRKWKFTNYLLWLDINQVWKSEMFSAGTENQMPHSDKIKEVGAKNPK